MRTFCYNFKTLRLCAKGTLIIRWAFFSRAGDFLNKVPAVDFSI